MEDFEEVAAFDQAVASDAGVRFPVDVAHAMGEGAHPVRAWRDHRGLTQGALATAAGVSKPFCEPNREREARRLDGDAQEAGRGAGSVAWCIDVALERKFL